MLGNSSLASWRNESPARSPAKISWEKGPLFLNNIFQGLSILLPKCLMVFNTADFGDDAPPSFDKGLSIYYVIRDREGGVFPIYYNIT